MKIKPLYMYLFGIVLAVAVFFFVSSDSGTSQIPAQREIAGRQMPNDAVHKGLHNPGAQMPDKNNVDSTIIKHLEMLKTAVDKDPRDTLKLREYANFLSAAHKPDEALKYYERILKVNPERTDIILSVAYIHYTERNFDEAEKMLKSILSYDKNNLKVYYNLGAIAYSAGNKVKAKEIWTKLSKEHPKTAMGEMAKKAIAHM